MASATIISAAPLPDWVRPALFVAFIFSSVGIYIIPQALAQLAGPWPSARGCSFSQAPVAFSFGWLYHGSIGLAISLVSPKLRPEFEFQFKYESLGRFPRHHEKKYPTDAGDVTTLPYSPRTDRFQLEPDTHIVRDYVWWLSWITIAIQFVIAALPWITYHDRSVLYLTAYGTALALGTRALQQWKDKKWAAHVLSRDKVLCLTRVSDAEHVLVLQCKAGAWDPESAATAPNLQPRGQNFAIAIFSILAWTLWLICAAGLQDSALCYLGAVSGIGIAQTYVAARAAKDPSAYGLVVTHSKQDPAIIGGEKNYKDEDKAQVSMRVKAKPTNW
ncbi:uncharacterized protein B0I36DRAFT_394365 [Microdochium trichocladiopsis]|uniref:Uncharacterized protein n=1 Tax=Microdochium trichocladiopsis TaxID=1682393 RepID=A0A9P9BP78_9PEZI|nr:uncharacterized protein B0I36DRAFT_394365 [Microdochium trichocladiopsis]KAH7021613.1 hypothetical protein B0I36DRAFT_394365 [Microdochium trichocladiopsis]